ncbi:MAG: membrane protein insertion efficiency factor YidD [Candidatus Kinetoplastibacterium crithidii]|nr:MAG: membrane protein insertion efficiency factor YidD [Candidatus Kinetoplastibacterium crithidii]
MHKKIVILLIESYQHILSPWIGKQCRFNPSCSQYAIESIKRYNIFYAFWLIFYRLLRCNPWCKGGQDPVPYQLNKKNDINKK